MCQVVYDLGGTWIRAFDREGREAPCLSSLSPRFHTCCPEILAARPGQMRWESDLISHGLRPPRGLPLQRGEMGI